jgi:diacylglycerol kinase (ATP)
MVGRSFATSSNFVRRKEQTKLYSETASEGVTMKHIFIINPVAGNGKLQEKLEKTIHLELKDRKFDYEVYITKSEADTRNFTELKCKENVQAVLYACGGDGTLHEVINAACRYKHVSIGVIPVGSGNDFIKNFKNNINFSDINLQTEGENIELDLIKVNNEYAATVLNIGLDADVAFNMNKFKKIPFIQGPTRYYLSILYSLFNKLGKQIIVETENGVINGSFLIGVVANGQYYGSGYKCAPKAMLNDGILDLCFVENISRLKILSLIASYKKGEHLENPKISKYVTYDKIKQAKIKFDEPTNVCMDGDKFIYNEVNISAEKNALNFWLPKGVQLQSQSFGDNYS